VGTYNSTNQIVVGSSEGLLTQIVAFVFNRQTFGGKTLKHRLAQSIPSFDQMRCAAEVFLFVHRIRSLPLRRICLLSTSCFILDFFDKLFYNQLAQKSGSREVVRVGSELVERTI